MKTLTILLILPLASLCAQIRPDFLLADSASGPSLSIAPDGKLYIAWTNWKDTSAVYNIFDNMLNPTRSILGVSNTPEAWGSMMRVENGGGLILWNYWDGIVYYRMRSMALKETLIGTGLYMQLFNTDGDTVGGNFRADFFYQGGGYDVTYLNDTSFVVIWRDGTSVSNQLYGRLGSNSSGMAESYLHLNDDRPQTNSNGAKVTANSANGDFMVAWVENRYEAPKRLLLGRIFDQNGTPKSSSVVLTPDTLYDDLWSTAIRHNSNGEYLIAWSEKRDSIWHIKLKRVNENGLPLGNVETVYSDGNLHTGFSFDVVVDTTGDFLVVWEQPENVKSKIYGQRYSSDGTAIGTNFKISFFPDTVNHFFFSIALNEKKIYVVWHASSGAKPQVWGKILDFDNPITAVEHPPTSTPVGFQLFNNYPNPFNPSTQIRYSIKDAGYVSLKVYDLLGREIAVLVNAEKQPGTYSIEWNAGHLPSGMYFSRLESGGRAIIQKLLLVR